MRRLLLVLLGAIGCGNASRTPPPPTVAATAPAPPAARPEPPPIAPPPLAPPPAGHTRVTIGPRDLPGFGLTDALVIDVAPPFAIPPTIADPDTPAASLELARPGGPRPLRIFRPALVDSLDAIERGYRLTPEVVVHRADPCVLAETRGAAPTFVLDCIASAPSGPVVCSYEDASREHVEAARAICRSIAIR